MLGFCADFLVTVLAEVRSTARELLGTVHNVPPFDTVGRPAFQLHLRDVVPSHVEAPVLLESRRWCRIYVVRPTRRSGRPPLSSSPAAVLARLPCPPAVDPARPPATGSTSAGRNGNRSSPPVRRPPRSVPPASAAPPAPAAPAFGKRT